MTLRAQRPSPSGRDHQEPKRGLAALPAALVARPGEFAAAGEAVKLYEANKGSKNIGERVPANPLLFVPRHLTRTFYQDLDTANIPRQAFGSAVDFHSLRTTYISLVLATGATTKEEMELARHSSPNLTLSTYGRVIDRDSRLRELTEKVAEMALPDEKSVQTCVQRQAVGAEIVSPNSPIPNDLRGK